MKYIWLFHRMIIMSNRSHPNPISRAAVILTENGRSKTCVTLSSTIQPDFITEQSSIGIKIFFFADNSNQMSWLDWNNNLCYITKCRDNGKTHLFLNWWWPTRSLDVTADLEMCQTRKDWDQSQDSLSRMEWRGRR